MNEDENEPIHPVTEHSWPFALDRFQLEAISAIDEGRSVLVAAPTSSGKTVLAEHAIDCALKEDKRAFYTAPIKALSNQKFLDFRERFGVENVGILTGDVTVNSSAPVLVMTTEVLRNMLYAESAAVEKLAWVILDEVHYLEDPYRGPVWEEVILSLPKKVQIVALSATISNVDQLGQWLTNVRGETQVVVHHERPVPLKLHYFATNRMKRKRELEITPLLLGNRANPDGKKFLHVGKGTKKKDPYRRFTSPRYIEILLSLQQKKLLPCIHFVFSRAGCDEARDHILKSGISLNSQVEQEAVDAFLDESLGLNDDQDLEVLGVKRWREGLCRGVASHHAGLIPQFKEITEKLFKEGLLKIVYATETLALGVNLPARSVVIDKMTKFNGHTHELLTPSQFTQITGRAGRRGLDKEGHGVVLWSPFVHFNEVAELALNKTFHLQSAFRPTYNMVANLMNTRSRSESEDLLRRSFGQFQLDQSKNIRESGFEDISSQIIKVEGKLNSRMNTEISWHSISRLKPGEIVLLGDGQIHAVLAVADRSGGRKRIKTINQKGQYRRFVSEGILESPLHVSKIDFLNHGDLRRTSFHKEIIKELNKRFSAGVKEAGRLQKELFKLSRRLHELELGKLETDLVGQLASTAQVLEERDLANNWSLTESGQNLKKIYSECDLVVVEALNAGCFDGLTPPELAALLSIFVYSHRGNSEDPDPLNSAIVHKKIREIELIANDIELLEKKFGVESAATLDSRYAGKIYDWALGLNFSDVLDSTTSGGEFVRNVRLVIDLLRQIRSVSHTELRKVVSQSIETLERGVVVVTTSFSEESESIEV